MRIGVIADIHGNAVSLGKVLNTLKRLKIDKILCLGDIIGYYPFVNESIELVRKNVDVCIMGNHEAYLLNKITVREEKFKMYGLDYVEKTITKDNLDWLAKLPQLEISQFDNLRFHLYHGSPFNSLEEYIYPDYSKWNSFKEVKGADFILLGHTHWPLHKKIGKMNIVNPGSCGQPRDHLPKPSFAIIDTENIKVEFHRISYNKRSVALKTKDVGLPEYLINKLYDKA